MRRFDRGLSSILASCALAGALAAPAIVRAAGVSPIDASAEQKKQATAHFLVGKHALESQSWERAISELNASLEEVDSPNARLELARALRDSGKLAEAWTEFGRAAEAATALAPREDRYAKTAEAASSERQDVAAKIAFVEVTVTHAPADATLKIGDRSVVADDWSAPFPVVPGAVDVVVASAAGAELARITVNVSVGQSTPVSLDAQPSPSGAGKTATNAPDDEKPEPAAQPQPLAPPPDASPRGRKSLRTAAYITGGLGVAGLATFAVFGLLSNSTYNDLKTACPRGCPPDKQSEVDSGITEQTIANVGLAAGLFGLAAGTTLFLLSPPPPTSQAPATAIVVGPAYLGVRGSL